MSPLNGLTTNQYERNFRLLAASPQMTRVSAAVEVGLDVKQFLEAILKP
jgi:hypothetical protein